MGLLTIRHIKKFQKWNFQSHALLTHTTGDFLKFFTCTEIQVVQYLDTVGMISGLKIMSLGPSVRLWKNKGYVFFGLLDYYKWTKAQISKFLELWLTKALLVENCNMQTSRHYNFSFFLSFFTWHLHSKHCTLIIFCLSITRQEICVQLF